MAGCRSRWWDCDCADVTVGGMTGFTGHLSVCDKVHIGANALVIQSLYLGILRWCWGVMKADDWRKAQFGFGNWMHGA